MRQSVIQLKFLVVINLCVHFSTYCQTKINKPEIKSAIASFSEMMKSDLNHLSKEEHEIENEFEEHENAVSEVDESFLKYDLNKNSKKYNLNSTNRLLITNSISPEIDFDALDDDNIHSPPDVNGAVGPNHVMTILNSEVRIQDLSGNIISTVSLNAFWSPVTNQNAFDPRMLYDPYSNRWIACAGGRTPPDAKLLIGVSENDDPTGNWYLYSLDADETNQNWIDYPRLAYTKDWIVVTINEIVNSSNSFFGSQVYIFNKQSIYNHDADPLDSLLRLSTSYLDLCPAVTFDTSISTLYLVQTASYLGNLSLYTIDKKSGTILLTAPISIRTQPWSGQDIYVPQLGATSKIIATNTDGIHYSVYRNGSIWTVHTIGLPTVTPTHSGIQWFQLSTNGDILQQGRFEDNSGEISYGFPSIAVNSSNYAMIGYAKLSSSIHPSAAYRIRAFSDPPNTFQSEFLYKAGLDTYVKNGISERWGDYSATMTDPGGLNFWTLQEYSQTHLNSKSRWGTRWAKVSDDWDTCHPYIKLNVFPGNDICIGTKVKFIASATNTGTSPFYQWKKDGMNVGDDTPVYIDSTLTDENKIWCVMTSYLSCAINNQISSDTIEMNVHGPTLLTNILIEGYYSGDGKMKTSGTGYLNSIDNILHPDSNDVDTIYISAMKPDYPFEEVDRQMGILKVNGDLIISFDTNVVVNNWYYLKVNHRNSVETWSYFPVQLYPIGGFAFSEEGFHSYGNNEVLVFDSVAYAIYSGDVNQDGAVDATDFIEIDPVIRNGEEGYQVCDINGDGSVDAQDYLILAPNIENGVGLFTP